jgi:hypothetical protein
LNRAALRAQSTERLETLSRPKSVLDVYRFPRELPDLIPSSAKAAEPTLRLAGILNLTISSLIELFIYLFLIELAKPKAAKN